MPVSKIWLASLLLLHRTVQAQQNTHDQLWRRHADAVEKLTWQQPQGIRKMSEDPGEKFWAHYWDLEDAPYGNTSMPDSPAKLHDDSKRLYGRMLFARDASCPTNYSPCTSIGHADSCCPNGKTCILVQDTGNGPVGCCSAGSTCGDTIGGCDTSQGYTSCPNSSNKGCCIPGFVCAGNICINANTQTVTATTSTSTTTPVVVSVTTVTVTNVNTSGLTTTATVTVTQSGSDTAVAPVRPTTESTAAIVPASITTTTSTSTTTSSTSTTETASYCPTGFYMCSAVYLGGCCRVDRDCNTTSCPPTASTTVINGSPVIVAPSGASSNAQTCATGWYSCAASLGGNCCPNGYSCGQTNCPASVSGVAAQNKQVPSEAATTILAWLYVLIASSALAMILL